MIKVPYEEIPEDIKISLQEEIDKIGDNQNPYYLYHNIVMSTGTTGSLANLFELPFDLVLKIKELNGHMGDMSIIEGKGKENEQNVE